MSATEIYIISAATVLITMVLGQAYEERCRNKERESSRELKEIKKRLELLEKQQRA